MRLAPLAFGCCWAVGIHPGLVFADPLMPHQLQSGGVYQFSQVLNSTYNVRIVGDYIYASQINTGSQSIARYQWGNPTPLQQRIPFGAPEHRMNAPFLGANPSYVLAAGGTSPDNPNLSLYDINDYSRRVDTPSPWAVMHNSFDWVDADTIIAGSYTSGTRKNLYLIDVHVSRDPFSGGIICGFGQHHLECQWLCYHAGNHPDSQCAGWEDLYRLCLLWRCWSE